MKRCAEVEKIIVPYLLTYNIKEIVAPNDGAGVCYSVCTSRGVTCHSYDPSKAMIDVAKQKGNVVLEGDFETAISKNKGVVFFSHSETLDPGGVVFAMKLNREVIAYEMGGMFLGMCKLHMNMPSVYSSFPLRTVVNVGGLPRYNVKSSWFKIGKYGTNFYTSDYRCIESLSILTVLQMGFTVSTTNMFVIEACAARGIRLAHPAEDDIGLYWDECDRVCRTFFSIREGRFHSKLRAYHEWKNYVYTPFIRSNYTITLVGVVYYRHASRMVGELDGRICTLSSLNPVLENTVYETIEMTQLEKLHYDSHFSSIPYNDEFKEYFDNNKGFMSPKPRCKREGNVIRSHDGKVKLTLDPPVPRLIYPTAKCMIKGLETYCTPKDYVCTYLAGIMFLGVVSYRPAVIKQHKELKREQFRKRKKKMV